MELVWALNNLTPSAIIDILLVALLFFGASFFIRGTQSVALLRGMILVLGAMVVFSNIFNLLALRWLLENTLTVLAIAIPGDLSARTAASVRAVGARRSIHAAPAARYCAGKNH